MKGENGMDDWCIIYILQTFRRFLLLQKCGNFCFLLKMLYKCERKTQWAIIVFNARDEISLFFKSVEDFVFIFLHAAPLKV